MIKECTYSLKGSCNNSDQFYRDLGTFTDEILEEAEVNLGRYVDDFTVFVQLQNIEILRPRNDYFPELIMTGVYWKNYLGNALKTGNNAEKFLKFLYRQRKKIPQHRAKIDKLRGYLAYIFLEKSNRSTVSDFNLDEYKKLINWLSATGEFNEEVNRLNQWIDFCESKTAQYTGQLLTDTVDFAERFLHKGKEILGGYVTNLQKFHRESLPSYKYREDYFFAGKQENEYYLNMFGAEVLNRGLKKDFDKTARKVLLLPTCMRAEPATGCKARSDGKELVCASCSFECNIGKVASKMSKQGITSYLIPHSSDFSRFLVKWKDTHDTSLIGVACVLNLIAGGYEMKRLNIPSQCVFLDYCGCKKHWDRDGIATSLNVNQVKRIIHKPGMLQQKREEILS